MTLPQPNREFQWTQAVWGPALRCVPLSRHASHLFTTRALSLRGEPRETAVAWAHVAAGVALRPERLVRLRQVHGAVVEVASSARVAGRPEDWPEADAIISNDPTIGLAVRMADCVTVLMADTETGCAAAVHAGWRGTLAGAALAAVQALEVTYGTRPAHLVAAIGPSIGPCCYVIGPELRQSFSVHPEAGSWFTQERGLRLDLWRASRDQLLRAGLLAARVHTSELCTACHADLFCSYRKEGSAAGRMAAVIKAGGRR